MRSRSSRMTAAAAAVMAGGLVLYRLVSLLYSYAATNVLYAESALPSVLEYVRGVFYAVFAGAYIAGVVSLGKKERLRVWIISSILLILDGAAALIIDHAEGAISQASALVALLNVAGDCLYTAALLWLCLPLTAFLARIGKEGRAIAACSLLFFAGRLIPWLVSVVSFLIDVEFAPYTREVLTIVGELLRHIVLSGGCVLLAASACAALYHTITRK